MTAEVLDIHDFLPAMVDPPAARDEPATVIILPTVRVERAPCGVRRGRRERDDGPPSDCP